MDDTQQRGVVAGFLHLLATDKNVFNDWQNCERSHEALGAFVKKTMGLQTAPTADELASMSVYSDKALKPQVQAIAAQGASMPNSLNYLGLDHESD